MLRSFGKMALGLIVLASLLALGQAGPYLGTSVPPLLGSRITGGQNANKGEFPHQVSLQYGRTASSVRHFCAGSIINAQWILTAGHCVLAVPSYGTFVVKAGKHNINAREAVEQVSVVEKSYVHERYPGSVAPYDIALLKLRTPLKFKQNVKSIKLPKANSLPTTPLILSGWGSVSLTSQPIYPDILQKVNLTVVDLATCKSSIERLTGSAPLASSNVCTGPTSGGISACSGDSGGPLIKVQNGQKEIVGIVSWGIIPCGTRGAPSVYTRVSAYIDWINSTINGTNAMQM